MWTGSWLWLISCSLGDEFKIEDLPRMVLVWSRPRFCEADRDADLAAREQSKPTFFLREGRISGRIAGGSFVWEG